MDKAFVSYRIEERSYVSYIKREIHGQVVRAKFTAPRTAEIDLIVSEITSNIIKHAGHGELLYRIQTSDTEGPSFEIISIDNGPGIADTARMIRDGVSTTHTLGHGLGSINRLSSLSQLYSLKEWGTILYAIVKTSEKKATATNAKLEVSALCVNKPRETVCGDGYVVKKLVADTIMFFADGLGHGRHAKEAVDQAGDFFFQCNENDPVEIIRQMHENIRKTRGLVATVVRVNLKAKLVSICGVGNISTRVYNGIEHRNYMSYNGTIGLNIPSSMNASSYPLESNQQVIMHTDGIQSRWDLNKYPAIQKYHNMILAAAVYKDFSRRNDDASVLIAKTA